MSEPKYRLLRILEYVGDREWIDDQIAKRNVKGTYDRLPNGRVIREAIIGDTVELLESESPEFTPVFRDAIKK